MALPWGSQSSSTAQLEGGRAEITILPFEMGSTSRSVLSLFRPAPRFSVVEGTTVGAPGSPYQIEVAFHEPQRPAGSLRIVRASINGVEINEQLVLRGRTARERFIGWLDSPDGTKRVHFTFPATAGETVTIQLGVFEAIASASGGKKGGAMSAPPTAMGQGFHGPPVSTEQYSLGQPLAIAEAKLRAQP